MLSVEKFGIYLGDNMQQKLFEDIEFLTKKLQEDLTDEARKNIEKILAIKRKKLEEWK